MKRNIFAYKFDKCSQYILLHVSTNEVESYIIDSFQFVAHLASPHVPSLTTHQLMTLKALSPLIISSTKKQRLWKNSIAIQSGKLFILKIEHVYYYVYFRERTTFHLLSYMLKKICFLPCK